MTILSPGANITAKNTFLLDSSQISKLPVDALTWQHFIFELSRWIENEEGSFTPTFNGFSADPASPTINWVRFGPIVNVRLGFTTKGTSDDTVFQVTNWPEKLRPDTEQIVWFFGGHDNTADSSEPISAVIGNSATVSFGLGADNPSGGGWTGSGTKGFTNASISFSYNLWSKGM